MYIMKKFGNNIRSGLRKMTNGAKTAFTKQKTQHGLRVMGDNLSKSNQYIKEGGQILGDAAPLVAMTGVGLPVAMAMKAASVGAKLATRDSNGRGNVLQYAGNANRRSKKDGIQAPRKMDPQTQEMVYY